MRRKFLVSLIFAAIFAESIGCAGTKPVIRGQSPEKRIDLARFRRRIRRDVEPVLDATFNVGKKAEPAWDATKDVTRKGVRRIACPPRCLLVAVSAEFGPDGRLTRFASEPHIPSF